MYAYWSKNTCIYPLSKVNRFTWHYQNYGTPEKALGDKLSLTNSKDGYYEIANWKEAL